MNVTELLPALKTALKILERYKGKSLHEALTDLLALVEANEQQPKAPKQAIVQTEVPALSGLSEVELRQQLNVYTIPQLKSIASQLGLKMKGKAKKSEIIAELYAHQSLLNLK